MKIVVTGGTGFLGSHIMKALQRKGYEAISLTRANKVLWWVDLRSPKSARHALYGIKPDIVINCAANQGGIAYDKLCPATIFYDNLMMGTSTMEATRLAGVKKYVNIIAGCAYPGDPKDGILKEDELFAGPMHPTVENYGIAKRAAVLQAKYYRQQYDFNAISLILINLYGPGEHFHPDRSHALAALLRKFYEAKRDNLAEVTVWGTGRPIREWLYVEDAAEGIIRAMECYDDVEPLNIATGKGYSITELAEIIAKIVDYQGEIVYDAAKPEGALRKTGDITKMKAVLGWEPPTPLGAGIRRTLDWLADNYDEVTKEK